jgi:hypothetical protein
MAPALLARANPGVPPHQNYLKYEANCFVCQQILLRCNIYRKILRNQPQRGAADGPFRDCEGWQFSAFDPI